MTTEDLRGAGRRWPRPRPGTWPILVARPLGLALVAAGLAVYRDATWSAADIALATVMGLCWACWCVLSTRAGLSRVPLPKVLVIVDLAGAVVSGGLLITLEPEAVIAGVIVIMAVMSAAAELPPLESAGVLAAGALAIAVGDTVTAPAVGTWAIVGWTAMLVAGHLAATTRRSLRIQQAQAEELLAQNQRMQQERERAAELGERTRIAREIHDVLAHSLGALAVQLDVTDSLLTAEPPRTEQAVERVRKARRLAVDGLTETRRAIEALRADTPPLPDALRTLVADQDTATLHVRGTPRTLTAEVTLALLRVAQEALANAAKHAHGRPVAMALRYDADTVGLVVTSGTGGPDGPFAAVPGVSGGYGLAGMRERLLLIGGDLTAGPVDGGWRVHAEVAG
ncbi:sensor histidine kinase [Streptomyces sp. NPDC058683]|uniref:sensor histidine kinase n=1 Tax=Streptomyces sp. NPDC058683 TaxID=3346597 RepID=UPI00365D677D